MDIHEKPWISVQRQDLGQLDLGATYYVLSLLSQWHRHRALLLKKKKNKKKIARFTCIFKQDFVDRNKKNTLIKKFKGSFRSFAVIFERKVTER